MRRALDMGEREALEISVEGGAILLRRANAGCVFCSGTKDVSVFRGKNICGKCKRDLLKA